VRDRPALALAGGLVLAVVLSGADVLAQAPGGIAGRVVDASGGVIADVLVEVTGPSPQAAKTDARGEYRIGGLAPGTYDVLVTRARFAPFAQPVVVAGGATATLDVTLNVAPIEETTVVEGDAPLGLGPEESAGAIILREEDLDALPDDPDDLAQALHALAGPGAGLGGEQLVIDGFSGGRLPPKTAIREIRLNANPFSAEFARPGFGRVSISTRRGLDRVRGGVALDFASDRLTWQSPFVANQPKYDRRQWNGYLGMPLSKSASVNVDFEHLVRESEQVIHATVLDDALQPVDFRNALVVPDDLTTVSPRIEFRRGRHAVLARYSFTEGGQDPAGIGGFVLPSSGFRSSYTQHALQLIGTSMASDKLGVETHIQLGRGRSRREGDDSTPMVQVLEAFTGGGAPVGRSFNDQDWAEVRSMLTWTPPKHAIRFGFRLRGSRALDVTDDNSGGTVTFGGGVGTLTSLERYRRTLLYSDEGLPPAEVRALGGGASQLRLTGGDPRVSVTQGDAAVFVQDDWRVAQRLTLSLGLRYENQTNVSSHDNVGPRLAFAWSPAGARGKPTTILRGGFGLFYNRIDDDLTLQARRFREGGRRQYVVDSPEVLDQITYDIDGVTGLPSLDELEEFAAPRATRQLSPDLAAPRTYQGSLSLEQLLPGRVTASVAGVVTRGRRLLRSRNINAPLPDTGVFPLGRPDAVYQYESTGRLDQKLLIFGLNAPAGGSVSLFARYFLGRARSDTNGPTSFPANSYDLAADYGDAATDVRHRFTLGGTLRLPWGFYLSPFVVASSARPFNITTGRDDNGDTILNDRPAFAANPYKPGVVRTAWGDLDPHPEPGQPPIPRNLGRGPSFLVVNLRVSKAIGLGSSARHDEAQAASPSESPAQKSRSRVTFTVSANVQNLLNRANPGSPVGNLSSPSFGQSLGSAGDFGQGGDAEGTGSRRIAIQARLGF
jgi:hypothetical protein